jgi:hypothetical protein
VSIINEALRKTQEQRKNIKPLFYQPRVKLKRQMVTLFAIAGMLTVAGMLVMKMSNHPSPSAKSASSKSLTLKTQHEMPNKMKIALDGVFVSDRTKIAYLNNQALQLGDTINGMKIVEINLDTIKLRNEDNIYELRTGASL